MSQLEMIPGTTRDTGLSQWFTPPELAAKVVEWALQGQSWAWNEPSSKFEGRTRPLRVLEPSAGNGALVRPAAAAGAEVMAVELDGRYADELRSSGAAWHWLEQDFLKLDPAAFNPFDLVLQNPPYEDGQDVKFILHALKFAPRVVGIFRADIWYGVERYDELWSQVRPTRVLNLKRRWFKNPQTGKGGETNYVCLELVKRGVLDKASTRPDQVSMEWW
jgi:predicted RNA methylase